MTRVMVLCYVSGRAGGLKRYLTLYVELVHIREEMMNKQITTDITSIFRNCVDAVFGIWYIFMDARVENWDKAQPQFGLGTFREVWEFPLWIQTIEHLTCSSNNSIVHEKWWRHASIHDAHCPQRMLVDEIIVLLSVGGIDWNKGGGQQSMRERKGSRWVNGPWHGVYSVWVFYCRYVDL